MKNIKQVIETQLGKYNSENDVPDGVQVTWVDMRLIECIGEMAEKIDELEKRLEETRNFAMKHKHTNRFQ